MPSPRPKSVRLPPKCLQAINLVAKDLGITEHAAIIMLIERGLGTITLPPPVLPEKPTAKQIVAFANDRAAYRSRWAV